MNPVTCSICGVTVHRKSLKRHIARRHASTVPLKTTAESSTVPEINCVSTTSFNSPTSHTSETNFKAFSIDHDLLVISTENQEGSQLDKDFQMQFDAIVSELKESENVENKRPKKRKNSSAESCERPNSCKVLEQINEIENNLYHESTPFCSTTASLDVNHDCRETESNFQSSSQKRFQTHLIMSSKSVTQLLTFANEFELSQCTLVCKMCKVYSRGKCGRFVFEFLNAFAEVPPEKKKQFSNLKGRIIVHLNSKTHEENCKKAKSGNERLREESAILPTSFEDRLKLIRKAKSVEELLDVASEFERKSFGFACKKCSTTANHKLGVVGYEFSKNGENFEKTKMSPSFSHSKQAIIDHLKSTTHQYGVVKKPSKKEKHVLEQAARRREAGMNLARNAYASIKHKGSYLRHSLNASIDGSKTVKGIKLEIGDKQHSSKFAASMTTPFFEVSKMRLKEILNEPLEGTGRKRFFSVIADKGSPNKKTCHVIGLVTPMREKVEAFFLSAYEVKDNSGKGLADDIYDTLLEYFTQDEIKTRFVGLGADGQYVHCNVITHLLSKLNVEESQSMFQPGTWDVSHQVELAGKHVRGETAKKPIQVAFIRSTYAVITEVSQMFNYGKEVKNLRAMAKESSTEIDESSTSYGDPKRNWSNVKKFRNFSDTRFTTYSYEVINAFRHNYHHVYKYLQMSSKKNPLQDRLNNATFVLQLAGLEDAYRSIGLTSRKLQTQNLFTWNVHKILRDCDLILTRMAESLGEDIFWPVNEDLAVFNGTVNNLLNNGTFMGIPILNDIQPANLVRSTDLNAKDTHFDDKIDQVRKKLSDHISKFNIELQKIYNEEKPEVVDLERIIFSINEILSRAPSDVPETFSNYVKLSKTCGFLESGITIDEMKTEYGKLLKLILNHVNNRGLTNKTISQNQEVAIYMEILHQENDKTFSNIMHLFSAACTRTYAEAITEGFGSILASKYKGRENLDIVQASQECFVAINCPPATKKADPLLESALNKKFEGKDWNVVMKSESRKLKYKRESKPILKMNEIEGKIKF